MQITNSQDIFKAKLIMKVSVLTILSFFTKIFHFPVGTREMSLTHCHCTSVLEHFLQLIVLVTVFNLVGVFVARINRSSIRSIINLLIVLGLAVCNQSFILIISFIFSTFPSLARNGPIFSVYEIIRHYSTRIATASTLGQFP